MNEIKQLSVADYDEVAALSQFAFQYELSEQELHNQKAEAERFKIWGSMVNDKLAAQLHLIPLACYINGQSFEMGGIASVATWPEYRRQGMVKRLLKHALNDMKKNGQTISLLHPFSFSFYRKYGWELAFTNHHYSIPFEKVRKDWEGVGSVRRIQTDIPLLHSIYTDYAKEFTGMLVRDENWWEQRVLKGKGHIAVAYNEEDQAEGYIIYEVRENVFQVKELAYRSMNGWRLLLQFIANHDSMAKEIRMTAAENDRLPLLLDEPIFDQKVAPYFMARIVDVFAFLKQYPFEKRKETSSGTVVLRVEDSFLPENNGSYQLIQTNDGIKVTNIRAEGQQGIHCTIQQLTMMLLGYKRPMELFHADLLQASEIEIEQFEALIPQQQTFLSDFF